MNRKEAFTLLAAHLSNVSLQHHCRAVAAVMEALAQRCDADVDAWYITGLLHDIDYETTQNDPSRHGLVAQDILKGSGITEEMAYAILSHSGNAPLRTNIDRALWASDPVTGLITAAAMLNPAHKISVLEKKSLLKKYRTKIFAAGANREQIASCEGIGLPVEDFLLLAQQAMARYESDLGF